MPTGYRPEMVLDIFDNCELLYRNSRIQTDFSRRKPTLTENKFRHSTRKHCRLLSQLLGDVLFRFRIIEASFGNKPGMKLEFPYCDVVQLTHGT